MIEDVRKNMNLTMYPVERIHYVIGKVEDTLPEMVPDRISLLRLDTDFYYSTCQELKHLYPVLEKDGVLIIDDPAQT